jgi:uncharacterized protein (DUF1800 family)
MRRRLIALLFRENSMTATALAPPEKLDPVEAWKPWQPTQKQPWDLKWAGHLYRRAAFGASLPELRQAVKDGPATTLGRLVDGPKDAADTIKVLNETGRLIAQQRSLHDFRAWWVYCMFHGPHPLREKLTLFWHDHFATSVNKVASDTLMYRQNVLIRRNALGKFGPFLQEMSKDPAMLIWLDNNSNVKGRANENYARELMELFSLGVHSGYTEKDIREAARAFTGWQTEEGQYAFVEALHDAGPKTVFRQKGNFNGDDVVRLCLKQPACAEFITRKLYRFYVSDVHTPSRELLSPLADAFRKSDHDIKVLVKTILSSRHFFSEHAYRQKIKSPVDLAVGAVWTLTSREFPPGAVVSKLEDMGQALFAPPNVKGWPGGTAWLNTSTVLVRHNFAHTVALGNLRETPQGRGGRLVEATKVVAPEAPPGKGPAPEEPLPPPPPAKMDLVRLVKAEKATTPEAIVKVLLDMLLQGDATATAKVKLVAFLSKDNPKGEALDHRIRLTAHMIMTMPEYQLN